MDLDNLEELQQFRLAAIAEIEHLKGIILDARKLTENWGNYIRIGSTEDKIAKVLFQPLDYDAINKSKEIDQK